MANPKTMGQIGSILNVGAAILGSAAGIAGIICLLISYLGLSKQTKRPEIKRRMIIWFVLSLIGAIIISIGIFTVYFRFMISEPSTIEDMIVLFKDSLPVIIPTFSIAYCLGLVSEWHFYKANQLLARIKGEPNFNTAGLLSWIGALTSIIFIGGIFYMISIIVLVVAFFGKWK